MLFCFDVSFTTVHHEAQPLTAEYSHADVYMAKIGGGPAIGLNQQNPDRLSGNVGQF